MVGVIRGGVQGRVNVSYKGDFGCKGNSGELVYYSRLLDKLVHIIVVEVFIL